MHKTFGIVPEREMGPGQGQKGQGEMGQGEMCWAKRASAKRARAKWAGPNGPWLGDLGPEPIGPLCGTGPFVWESMGPLNGDAGYL